MSEQQVALDERVFARQEIIVSAGTFNTPKLLMLSGIGSKVYIKTFIFLLLFFFFVVVAQVNRSAFFVVRVLFFVGFFFFLGGGAGFFFLLNFLWFINLLFFFLLLVPPSLSLKKNRIIWTLCQFQWSWILRFCTNYCVCVTLCSNFTRKNQRKKYEAKLRGAKKKKLNLFPSSLVLFSSPYDSPVKKRKKHPSKILDYN